MKRVNSTISCSGTESLKQYSYVQPTASGDENFSIATTLGSTTGKLDFFGRAVPQHDILAYKITNEAATGPKTKVVLMAGNHSGETGE